MIRKLLSFVLPAAFGFCLCAEPATGRGQTLKPFQAQTSSDRWSAYVKENFTSPGAYIRVLAPAISNQAQNEPSEWGQGPEGFFKRFGARYGQVQLQGALYHGSAAMLGQQTRYERCNCGGIRRLGYALSQTLVSRNTSGRWRPNVALLGGYYAGGMIATSWFPDRYRPLQEGVRSAHVQLGVRTVLNVFWEYSPELKRALTFGR